MASRHEYFVGRAMDSLEKLHGDTGVHRAASTGVETSVTLLVAEIFVSIDGFEHMKAVLRESAVVMTRGDYLTYDGRKWRVIEIVTQEDGLHEIDGIKAEEVN